MSSSDSSVIVLTPVKYFVYEMAVKRNRLTDSVGATDLRPVVNSPPTSALFWDNLSFVGNRTLNVKNNPEEGRRQEAPPPLFANRGGCTSHILPHVKCCTILPFNSFHYYIMSMWIIIQSTFLMCSLYGPLHSYY